MIANTVKNPTESIDVAKFSCVVEIGFHRESTSTLVETIKLTSCATNSHRMVYRLHSITDSTQYITDLNLLHLMHPLTTIKCKNHINSIIIPMELNSFVVKNDVLAPVYLMKWMDRYNEKFL